ncbi:hypothetical protein NZD88_19820 [Chryseobacterium antibioticum]|uniref:GLPGLI family protein n=1 Tax=Chryseobacterium pyrolae TaxID=2987481 RepID=A0ABT2INM7_9FLAO|nr:hypothetical protein [Chryseobacterium pyrolae]MCT2409807.1 hypothetical protein [Chryseobacterium pyrolae]
MKSFILLLCIIPILDFAQDKDKITNFMNEVYGNDYYFIENNVKPIVMDELNEDWEEVLSIEERNSYKVALKSQIINFNWRDFQLKKAILCIDGKPIVSEKNIPLESVAFVPEKSEKQNFNHKGLLTIYYRGKELTEKKKNKLYTKFLRNLNKRKNNIEYRVRISQPIFFGNNYVLTTKYSESLVGSTTNICVFKFESNIWKEKDCLNIQRHTQQAFAK